MHLVLSWNGHLFRVANKHAQVKFDPSLNIYNSKNNRILQYIMTEDLSADPSQ